MHSVKLLPETIVQFRPVGLTLISSSCIMLRNPKTKQSESSEATASIIPQLGRTNDERDMNDRNKKKLFTNRKLVHERRTQIHVLSFVQVERFYRISFLSFVQVERFCRISLLSFIRSCFVRLFMFRSSREQF